MSKTLTRVLWVLAGAVLIVAGVVCLVNPGAALGGLAAFFGVAMLFSGIVDIVIFAAARDVMVGAGWFLVDGILTVLLSIFLLCDEIFTAMTLPFIFGMWLMFSGITKFVNSFDLRAVGIRGWGWFTLAGIVLAAAGFLSFLSPVAGAMALSAVAGVLLIMQGIVSVLRGCLSGRLRQ